MARGFESKSVEQQQAEMLERRQAQPSRPRPTPEQQERDRKRQGLLLSRSHLAQQFQVADHPRRRQMLEQAIAELDRQLSSLE